LRESQAEELIPARETAGATVAAMPLHSHVEVLPGQLVHQLSEHELPGLHESTSVVWKKFQTRIRTAREEIVHARLRPKRLFEKELRQILETSAGPF
jgi:hypothetical protein